MSILNSFLGGGATALKKKAPATISANAITFSMGSEPSEYVLLALPSTSMDITRTSKVASIINTDEMASLFYFVRPYGTQYSAGSHVANASYSSGTFTISLSNYAFDTGVEYVLYYR